MLPMTIVAALFFRPPMQFDISPVTFFSIWVGLLGLMILMLYAAARQRGQRRDGLSRLALETGFEFIERPDPAFAAELAQIQVQQSGFGSVSFSNVLRGSYSAREFVIADLAVGRGKNRSAMSVASFKFPTVFPRFVFCPETLIWRLADKVGYKDIDFEDAPEFSRRFFLHSDDETAARALFTRDLRSAFEANIAPGLFVCASGLWLTVYRPNKMLSVEQTRELRQQGEMVAEAFRRVKAAGA
jgi:hypothetical protein